MQSSLTADSSRLANREIPARALQQTHSTRSINVGPNERLVSALAGGVAVAWGLGSRSWGGTTVALLGGGLVYRGTSGHCPAYSALDVRTSNGDHTETERAHASGYDVSRSATVQKSVEEVYRAWRKPETFVSAMGHLASVTPMTGGLTRWSLHDPLGNEHHWDTELVADEPNRLLRWATTDNAPLIKSLTLLLAPAPGDRGTEMKLRLRLDPPGGLLGSALHKLFGKVPGVVVQRALYNVKALLEAGELPSLKNNPAARASA